MSKITQFEDKTGDIVEIDQLEDGRVFVTINPISYHASPVLLSAQQVKDLVTALSSAAVTVRPEPTEFYILRCKVSDEAVVKVCFNGTLFSKVYSGPNAGQDAHQAVGYLNKQHGGKWNYIVVSKEDV